MTKRYLFGVAGVLSLTTAGLFVCSPVFADGPVNISIVEKVEDGSGGYKDWEDITDAVPGATYSAIPRIRNDGTVPVEVRMCLSESAVDGTGSTISLPANTFGITINSNWTLDDSSVNASDPAAGNCYNYNTIIEPGAVTEPIFTEIQLSSTLGNEYGNSTFSLHLDADAKGDAPAGSPDTGANSAREAFLVNSGLIFSTAGILALVIVGLRKIFRKN